MLWNIFCLWSGRRRRTRVWFMATSFCRAQRKFLPDSGRNALREIEQPIKVSNWTWSPGVMHVIEKLCKRYTRCNESEQDFHIPVALFSITGELGLGVTEWLEEQLGQRETFRRGRCNFLFRCCVFFAHSITSENMQKGRKKFQSSPAVPTQQANEANVIRSREWEERRARRSHKEWKYVLILCVSKKPQEFSLTVRQKTQKTEENNIFFFQSSPFYSRFLGKQKWTSNKQGLVNGLDEGNQLYAM